MTTDPLESTRAALREMEALAGKTRARAGRRARFRWWRPLLWVAVFVLSGVLLLRGATTIHAETGWPAWIVLLVTLAGAAVFASTGMALLARRIHRSLGPWMARIGGAMVALFSAYVLLYVSPDQMKRPEVAETYRALHPVLRMSVSTLILLDGRAVVTDAERQPEDYADMNLPVNPSSLHFRQPDGYVHAVDLRTRGRSEVAVWTTRAFLRLAGLGVLRHTGTADHLHVYLRPR